MNGIMLKNAEALNKGIYFTSINRQTDEHAPIDIATHRVLLHSRRLKSFSSKLNVEGCTRKHHNTVQ